MYVLKDVYQIRPIEQILAVLEFILAQEQFTKVGSYIRIDSTRLVNIIHPIDLDSLINKLESEKVIQQKANKNRSNEYIEDKTYYVKKGMDFITYREQILRECETETNICQDKGRQKERSAYRLTYDSKERLISLNDVGIHTFQSHSDNAKVFELIWNSPGKRFTIDEIYELTNVKGLPSLHQIVKDWKFKKNTRKAYIDVTTTSICLLRTEISFQELQALKIDVPLKI